MPDATTRRAAVEGWFTMPEPGSTERPTLIGCRCAACGTYVFPPRDGGCPSPTCASTELERVPLSTRGHIWSYTENQYAPPPPYVAPDPFEPYALAAVELDAEGLIILGKVSGGVMATDLRVGMPMQMELDTLFVDDEGVEHVVYTWAPAASATTEVTQ